MKKNILYFSILSIISFFLLTTLYLNNTYSEFDSTNVRNNIYVLSSDTLGGRLAGSTENLVAAEIIKNRFIDYGLKTLNGDGNYTQDFNTICPVTTNTSPYLKIEYNGDTEEELQYGVDFKEDMINFKNNTFSFSKSDKINSYLSYLDITCDDGTFLLYVPKDNNFSFRSSFFSDFAKDAVIMVSQNAFDKITSSLNEGKQISIHVPFEEEEKTISNVIGVIKGSNSSLSPFIITAHYDHLGKDGLGTSYSGALDNASGTSFILELSRSLSTYGKPERDIIFVALNAEELGLKGSNFFAENNYFDIKNSKVINFDMIGAKDCPITFIQGVAFKGNSSNILNSLSNICSNDSIEYLVEYENSSDHASFNELGIDALTICHSDTSHIHTPTDTVDYIDTDAINTVYKVVNKEIKKDCYSTVTTFIYSRKSINLFLIILLALIIIGILNTKPFKKAK